MCRIHRRRDGGKVVCVGYIGEGMGGEGRVCRIHRRRDGGRGSCV